MKRVLAFFALAYLSGCATVTRGTNEQIAFDTIPSGAEVRVVIDIPVIREGEVAPPPATMGCVTPCVLQVKRHDKMAVTVIKPGFESEAFTLVPKPSGEGVGTSIVGNAILGGAIGLVVDGVSGAGLDKCPNPVRISLRPVRPPPKGKRAANDTQLPSYDPIEMCKEQTAQKYKAQERSIVTNDSTM